MSDKEERHPLVQKLIDICEQSTDNCINDPCVQNGLDLDALGDEQGSVNRDDQQAIEDFKQMFRDIGFTEDEIKRMFG